MGFVLAGGRSSRMGRDKALLPFRGGALAEFVARTVRDAAGSVVLVGNPELYAPLGLSAIPDLYPGEGPLAGILTALAYSSASWNLVVACDMPGITVEVLRNLFYYAATPGTDAVLPAGPSGRLEPLCAIYHVRALPALERAFAGGIRKITAAFEGLRILPVNFPEAAVFHNVNTPEDWADYAGY